MGSDGRAYGRCSSLEIGGIGIEKLMWQSAEAPVCVGQAARLGSMVLEDSIKEDLSGKIFTYRHS